MTPFTRSDIFLSRDSKVIVRLQREPRTQGRGQSSDNRVTVVVDGDVEMLLDMSAQLLGAAQMIMERKKYKQ
jgi:hypothetical protein